MGDRRDFKGRYAHVHGKHKLHRKWIAGAWWVECPLCGLDVMDDDMMEMWDGRWRCKACWEPRHPQDFVRARADRIAVPGFTNSPSPDQFVDVEFAADTADDALPFDGLLHAGVVPAQSDADNTAITALDLSSYIFDDDSRTITYSATQLPTGLSIDSTTGIVTGTPAVNNSSDQDFNVTLTGTVSTVSGTQSINTTFVWTITAEDWRAFDLDMSGTLAWWFDANDLTTLWTDDADPPTAQHDGTANDGVAQWENKGYEGATQQGGSNVISDLFQTTDANEYRYQVTGTENGRPSLKTGATASSYTIDSNGAGTGLTSCTYYIHLRLPVTTPGAAAWYLAWNASTTGIRWHPSFNHATEIWLGGEKLAESSEKVADVDMGDWIIIAYSYDYSTGAALAYINTTQVANTTLSASLNAVLATRWFDIHTGSATPFGHSGNDGEIAEILAYDTAHDATTMLSVINSYLISKNGITSS